MLRFYFTFGQNHYTTKGQCMKDHFVLVMAADWAAARDLFTSCFTGIFMTAPDKWSFQYDQEQWDRVPVGRFRGGQYCYLGPIGAGGRFPYNLDLHTQDQKGNTDHDYDITTRQDVLLQIKQLKTWGWKSSCHYHMDGTIAIMMEHPVMETTLRGVYSHSQVRSVSTRERIKCLGTPTTSIHTL